MKKVFQRGTEFLILSWKPSQNFIGKWGHSYPFREELTKRVLRKQQDNPTEGDFIELVKKDFRKCDMSLDESMIVNTPEELYKTKIKTSIRKAAFEELKTKQQSHSKVKVIKYERFEVQQYIISGLFSNEEVSLLAALRSHTVRGIICNFRKMYNDQTECPLVCSPTSPLQDTQEHLLVCSKLVLDNVIVSSEICHDDIYRDVQKQKSNCKCL